MKPPNFFVKKRPNFVRRFAAILCKLWCFCIHKWSFYYVFFSFITYCSRWFSDFRMPWISVWKALFVILEPFPWGQFSHGSRDGKKGRILKSGGHVWLVLRKYKYPLSLRNFRPMRLKFGMYVPCDSSKQTTPGIFHISIFMIFRGENLKIRG